MKIPSVVAQNALVKQPTEDWVFTMPFARLLDGQSLVSIDEVRVFVGTYPDAESATQIADPEQPSDPLDLTLANTDTDEQDNALLRFTAGVHGRDYYIEVDVLTATGRVRSADGWLLVRDHQ